MGIALPTSSSAVPVLTVHIADVSAVVISGTGTPSPITLQVSRNGNIGGLPLDNGTPVNLGLPIWEDRSATTLRAASDPDDTLPF